MSEKILKWFFFSALVSISPFMFSVLRDYIFSVNSNYLNLVSKGELLIVTVGMAGATFGELILWKTDNRVLQLLLSGMTFVIFSWAQYLYVAVITIKEIAPDPAHIFNVSVWAYGSCVVISIMSMLAVAFNNTETSI